LRRRLPPRPGAFLPSRFFSTGRALLTDVMRRGRFADAGGLLSFRPSTSYRLRTTALWGRYFYPIGVPGLGGATAERLVSRGIAEYELRCLHVRASYDRPRRCPERRRASGGSVALEVHIFHGRQSVRMAGTAIGLRSRQGGLRVAWNLRCPHSERAPEHDDRWFGAAICARTQGEPCSVSQGLPRAAPMARLDSECDEIITFY